MGKPINFPCDDPFSTKRNSKKRSYIDKNAFGCNEHEHCFAVSTKLNNSINFDMDTIDK